MTRAHYILAELATRGVSISIAGNRLWLRPRSALTESLIARVLGAKAELLAVLRAAPRRAASPRAAVPALPALQWWVLWSLAQTPNLRRAELYACLPAPRPAVDDALTALLVRGELRARRDGALDLNVC
jgi:hypothetical protein